MSATKTIAENLLQELADAGDAAARCELGSRLSSDVGVGQDRDDDHCCSLLQAAHANFTPAALPRAAQEQKPRSRRTVLGRCAALVEPMAWVPAPVNSPWRGQVYKRDAEQEARLDDKLSAARAAAEARAARPLTPTTNYWRQRKEPGAGELCRAHAIRAFEAVERVEMALAAGDRVLVVKDELVPGAGWIFATRGDDDSGYVPRNYLVEEEASIAEAVLVKAHILTIDSDAPLTLSPMDWANRGRAIPCTWFFAHVLPPQKLIDALRDTLNGLPHFAARYTRDGSGLEPGGSVSVEVRRSTTPFEEAYVHTTRKSTFKRTAHEAYVPSKAGMDPDEGLTTTPLLKIRITLFDDGTAIGVLVQHSITDIEGLVAFMRAWSRRARGGDVSSGQDRWAPASTVEEEAPERWAPSEKPPEFLGVARKIRTEDCCVLPLPASTLSALKAAADGSEPYASTDDVLTARVWRALLVCRLAQLGLPISKAGTTCCLRAASVRQVLGLSEDYAGNATTDVCTELPAKELLGSRVGAVAGRLRRDLLATRTPEKVQARGAFFRGAQKMRQRIRKRFDEQALTFIVSSWSAPWDAVDFGAGPPVAFDHGAIVPVVCVFARRPQNDGVNVYVSLPKHLLGTFSECVFVNETASVLVEE